MNASAVRYLICAVVIALAGFGIYEEVTHVGAEHWMMGTWWFQGLSWFVAVNTLVYAVLGATKVTARRLPKGGVPGQRQPTRVNSKQKNERKNERNLSESQEAFHV